MSDTALENTKNLCYLFSWFANRFKSVLQGASELFWESKFVVKVQSLTTHSAVKSDIMSKGEIYFTAELPLQQHENTFIRISSEFIRILFHDCFGSNSPIFRLQELSELEIKILNSFCEFINEDIKEIVIPTQKISKEAQKNKGVYNITLLIGKEKTNYGKIVVTVPQKCLDVEKVELIQSFKDEDFLNVQTFVNILAGTSKISLNDLKNLSLGDIILLENSNINFMDIKTGVIRKSFKVNPNPSLRLDIGDDNNIQGNDMNENRNIWDNIQIEVSAEFDKIKMSLGELKQISKGLVIELGPIFDNEISLFVENKVVAKGELVIINDKYGVKIDEVYSTAETQGSEPQTTMPPTPPPPPVPPAPPTVPPPPQGGPIPQGQPPQGPPRRPAAQTPPENLANNQAQAGNEAEEFDYSDFENEDK